MSWKWKMRNPLAGVCYRDGAGDYLRVEATARLRVAYMAEENPKLYQQILRDFERGYRTVDDDLVNGIHEVVMKYCGASWSMSYFGKARIEVFLPAYELGRAREEVMALRELMQSPIEVTGHGRLSIIAPVERVRVDTKYGGSRRVPKVSHEFQQVRPLLVKYLAAERENRETVVSYWASKPEMYLDWRYS